MFFLVNIFLSLLYCYNFDFRKTSLNQLFEHFLGGGGGAGTKLTSNLLNNQVTGLARPPLYFVK